MQIVIDVPDEDYKRIKDMPDAFNSLTSRAYKSIKNGTPLPKGHGRLKDVDALINTLGCSDRDIYCKAVIEEDAPTIIEADKEAEDEAD